MAIVVAKEPFFAILAEEQAIYPKTTAWLVGGRKRSNVDSAMELVEQAKTVTVTIVMAQDGKAVWHASSVLGGNFVSAHSEGA